MDPDSLANYPAKRTRKVKFEPKVPKKTTNPVLPKPVKEENDIDAAKAEQLLRRYNEASLRGKSKVEKKGEPLQVAFGYGGKSSTIKSYSSHKAINKNPDGTDQRVGKEYKEPWDYYSYYPVSLPLRRPYSGNPELLDEEEFGEDSQSSPYDEYASNPAEELGLLDENMENRMFFFQLPTTMPTTKQSADKEPDNNAANPTKDTGKPCNMDALPAGFMGKMLVYKSGAIKLKLGDTIYDVSPGLKSVFAQDVVAINTEEKHCCNVGELNKRVVVTPDVEAMLDAMSELGNDP